MKEIYTHEELEKLHKRPQGNDFCEFRAWAIISLFIGTGIRAKELRSLKVQDVNLENSYIILNATKNKEARILPMSTTLYNVMAEWLQIRNAPKDDWLFCNIYGEQIQRVVLQTLVKRYSLSRGVERYGLHLYRHTFITLSVRSGMDSVILKRITGHKSIKMLEHYYQCNPTDLVNVIDKFNPLEEHATKRKAYTIKTNKDASRDSLKKRMYNA
jgi:integrase/recombinase XerD